MRHRPHFATLLALAPFTALPLQAHAASGSADPDAPDYERTRFSSTVFANASSRDGDLDMDLKRFFINIDHDINDVWSAHVTTDIQAQRHSEVTDLWARHAYVQYQQSKAFTLQLGAAPMPWIPRMSKLYGYRYIDPTLLSRAGVGSPAEWGVHAKGDAGDFSYALSVVTGSGYKKPTLGNSPDVEASLEWRPAKGWAVVAGGYSGKRALDNGGLPVEHTARRANLAVGYVSKQFRWGAQGFRASNWGRVTKPGSDSASGWSTWTSYQFVPEWSVFARYDRFEPSRDIDPIRLNTYALGGVEWVPSSKVRLALVGKHEVNETQARRISSNEYGVWTQLSF